MPVNKSNRGGGGSGRGYSRPGKGIRTVFGRIVGEALPTKHVMIGNVHLGPMPYATQPLEIPGGFELTSEQADSWIVANSADMRLRSNCLFWVSCSENSAAAAVEAVKK